MSDSSSLEFQIGQLTGQVTALITTVNTMSATIASIEKRMRDTETNMTALTAKLSLIAIVAGGVASIGMNLILKRYF